MTLLIILFWGVSFNSNINIVEENITETVGLEMKTVRENDSIIYLKWAEDDARDSVFQGEFSWNEYDKKGFVKYLKSVERLDRYTDEEKDEFGFLFADPSRFKGYKNKVSAIVFQGTPAQKKLLDEIRYITMDERFAVNTSAGIMPVYKGGYQGILDYFNNKFNSSKNHGDEDLASGNVLIGFVVGKNGKVSCAKILESTNSQLDKKAFEMVKSMPDWKPAMNGYPVPVFLAIQLIFFTD